MDNKPLNICLEIIKLLYEKDLYCNGGLLDNPELFKETYIKIVKLVEDLKNIF